MKKLDPIDHDIDEERKKFINFKQGENFVLTLGRVVRCLEGLQAELKVEVKDSEGSLWGLFVAEPPEAQQLRSFFQTHITKIVGDIKGVLEKSVQQGESEALIVAIGGVGFSLYSNVLSRPYFSPKGTEKDHHAHIGLTDYKAFRVLQDVYGVLTGLKNDLLSRLAEGQELGLDQTIPRQVAFSLNHS